MSSQPVREQLVKEALSHRAAHHPHLVALAEGTLPDPRWALADFARHYRGYSSHFPRYLTAVISRLDNPMHRQALLHNLSEESGSYSERDLEVLEGAGIRREWVQSVSHPRLFQRFAEALGVGDRADCSDEVICWRELLLSVLTTGAPAEAVGALGLGTEGIVREIYGYLVRAIDRFPSVSPRDRVFFPLHTLVDDEHLGALLDIAEELVTSDETYAQVRRGMLKALGLRCMFWDWLHQRALDPRVRAGDA